MKAIRTYSILLVLGVTLLACGGGVELSPEIETQLAEYENLIETYQSKFAGARGNTSTFKDVSDAYSADVQTWMAKWDTVAPTLSDDEGKAVKARIDSLNKRALRMLQGS